jgi:hypothetical protein
MPDTPPRRWKLRDGTPPLIPSPSSFGAVAPPHTIFAPILYTDGEFDGDTLPILTLEELEEKLDELFEERPYIFILWVGGTVIENIVPEARPEDALV